MSMKSDDLVWKAKKFDELTGDSLTAAERMMDSKDKDPGNDSPGGKKKKSFWK